MAHNDREREGGREERERERESDVESRYCRALTLSGPVAPVLSRERWPSVCSNDLQKALVV